jgi:RNA polymerase sigma-70 factor (ECF subfamily)
VLLKEGGLSRTQKECLLLLIAGAKQNTYCVTAHWEMLRSLGLTARLLDEILTDHHSAGLSNADVALLDFGLKLSQRPTWVGRKDIAGLRRHGFMDGQILEAVVVSALTDFLCALSEGLGAEPDFEPKKVASPRAPLPRSATGRDPNGGHAHEQATSYLRTVPLSPDTFEHFAFFREAFGFIPNIFRAQTLRPDFLEAEAQMVRTVLLTEDILPRAQKEYILLVISAANLNTYCVAVHCEMLRALGVSEEDSDQIAVDHHQAGLSAADTALLDAALKLNRHATEFAQEDIDVLRQHGFSEEQILEATAMTALTRFLNTLQMGLGPVPDFVPKRVFPVQDRPGPRRAAPPARTPQKKLHPLPPPPGLTERAERLPVVASGEDPDAGLVTRVREGDLGAFEELVRRHHRRLYRTLIGITGNPEDAEDGTQNVFLKVFKHIGSFRGGSRFTTWLTRIAINEGLGRLRERKVLVSLDAERPEEEGFRPRQVQAWEEDPEQLYSRAQIRELVERELVRLPAKYRVAVMLRDLEQLSTEEAARALRLPVTTLKSRLLRGRLMLREALAPHFTGGRREGPVRV